MTIQELLNKYRKEASKNQSKLQTIGAYKPTFTEKIKRTISDYLPKTDFETELETGINPAEHRPTGMNIVEQIANPREWELFKPKIQKAAELDKDLQEELALKPEQSSKITMEEFSRKPFEKRPQRDEYINQYLKARGAIKAAEMALDVPISAGTVKPFRKGVGAVIHNARDVWTVDELKKIKEASKDFEEFKQKVYGLKPVDEEDNPLVSNLIDKIRSIAFDSGSDSLDIAQEFKNLQTIRKKPKDSYATKAAKEAFGTVIDTLRKSGGEITTKKAADALTKLYAYKIFMELDKGGNYFLNRYVHKIIPSEMKEPVFGEWNGYGRPIIGYTIKEDRKKEAHKLIQDAINNIINTLKTSKKTKKTTTNTINERTYKSITEDRQKTLLDALYNLNKIAKKYRDKQQDIALGLYGDEFTEPWLYGSRYHDQLHEYKDAKEMTYEAKDKYLRKFIQENNLKPKGYHTFGDGRKRDYYEIDGYGFHIDENKSTKNLGHIDMVDSKKEKGKKMSEESVATAFQYAYELPDEDTLKALYKILEDADTQRQNELLAKIGLKNPNYYVSQSNITQDELSKLLDIDTQRANNNKHNLLESAAQAIREGKSFDEWLGEQNKLLKLPKTVNVDSFIKNLKNKPNIEWLSEQIKNGITGFANGKDKYLFADIVPRDALDRAVGFKKESSFLKTKSQLRKIWNEANGQDVSQQRDTQYLGLAGIPLLFTNKEEKEMPDGSKQIIETPPIWQFWKPKRIHFEEPQKTITIQDLLKAQAMQESYDGKKLIGDDEQSKGYFHRKGKEYDRAIEMFKKRYGYTPKTKQDLYEAQRMYLAWHERNAFPNKPAQTIEELLMRYNAGTSNPQNKTLYSIGKKYVSKIKDQLRRMGFGDSDIDNLMKKRYTEFITEKQNIPFAKWYNEFIRK